ncbi:amidohydrolase family protein [Deinococcus ruber]|uniref:Aminodeoxyfutalosine deaminase n=1 Tax=Deinococcus ruber TaxID=1848197 RepID=A0A918F1P9_9DEIO|nr:amidohydrolase family protein [Deinococcus ruber]GGQ99892.1 aminodeoxyfutalosine deaminase [Deinococcus ruber]
MSYQPTLYTADILYTGMGLPIRDGGVVVSGQTVAAAGPRADLRANYPQAQEVRVGRVISPPPVNAHTHLDMSLYQFQSLPYFDWIPQVAIAGRAQRGLEGAQTGLEAIERSGAAALGDIVWHEGVMEWLLTQSQVPGVAYWEVLDPNPATAAETFARTRERVERWRRLERPGGMRLGLSPHASHTVSHTLFRLLAEYAAAEGLPMQIHVLEHPSEAELFATGGGPLAASMARMVPGLSIPDILGRSPAPDLTAISYLESLGVLRARPTLIHMVNVTPADIKAVAQAGCPVVTCPRSNRNLHCGLFPWADYAAAGVEVALGTDSVASGETLDIHDEIRAAWALHPNLDPRQVVRAAVKGGMRVVGGRVPFIRRGDAWDAGYIWPQ